MLSSEGTPDVIDLTDQHTSSHPQMQYTKLAEYWSECKSHFANYIIVKLNSKLKSMCWFLITVYQQHSYLAKSKWKQAYQFYYNELLVNGLLLLTTRDFKHYLDPLFRILARFHKKKNFILVDQKIEQDKKGRALFNQTGVFNSQDTIVFGQILNNFLNMDEVYKVVFMGVRQITIGDGFFSGLEGMSYE